MMMVLELTCGSAETTNSQWSAGQQFNGDNNNLEQDPSKDKEAARSRLCHSKSYTCHQANLTGHCDTLIVNNQTIDFKLRWVGRCLTHLVLDEDQELSETFVCRQQSLTRTYQDAFRQHLERDRMRLKRIMGIYTILLKRLPSPIILQPMAKQSISGCNLTQTISLSDARRQVLSLIENLGGYCDSIDLLRCILKSNHMIGVIDAYDALTKKFNDYNNHNRDTVAAESTDVRQEFRIIQEWRF